MKLHAIIQERLQWQEVHGENERLAGWFKNRISLFDWHGVVGSRLLVSKVADSRHPINKIADSTCLNG